MALALTRRLLGAILFLALQYALPGCRSERQMRLDRWGATVLDSIDVEFQQERNDCGVACAIMLLRAHGIPADRARIRSLLQLQDEGANMLNLINVLEAEHLSACGIQCAPGYLGQIPLPAILFVDEQHYVVLDSIGNDRQYFLRDPALGRISVDKKSLEEVWSGVVLVVESRKRMR